MARSYVVALGAGIFFTLAQTVAFPQAVATYTSASTWQAAVQGSSQFSQNFSGVEKDSYFQIAALNTGSFSLQQVGQDPTFGLFGNFIDVPPLQFSDNDGNTYAAIYTKSGIVTVDMKFTSSVFAWGANFYGAEQGELLNLLLIGVQGNIIATVPVTVDTGFFGFTLSTSEAVSKITFESRLDNPDPSIGQGFGLENIVGACNKECVSATLVYSPPSVNFGNTVVGTKTAPQLITVTNNTGATASYLSSEGLTEFASTAGATCGETLAAGASCTFNVYFAPTAPGPANGSITVSTSAGPVTFIMSGTGIPGTLVYSPASVNFGDVTVGAKSAPILITVTNNTAATASYLSSIGLAEFASTAGATCGETLAAGASCTFSVYFAPTTPGIANGSITVSTSAGPVTFTMSGTGQAVQPADKASTTPQAEQSSEINPISPLGSERNSSISSPLDSSSPPQMSDVACAACKWQTIQQGWYR